MKTTKRIISFICVFATLLSMCAVGVFAADPLTCDDTVSASWTPLAAKYSKSTNGIIAPKGDGYAIRTTGFDYSADENGGIKVHTATYKENSGVYSVAAVSSKYKTALDGLTVELKPDDLKMECDSNNASTNISFVITENPVTRLAAFDEASSSYTTGLYNSVDVMSNGLRELTFEEGKALVVTVSNQRLSSTDDHVATAVAIVYDDGSYVNKNDGHNGFRWVFSARNYAAESSNGDHSGITQVFESIDFSEGLKLEIRADERLGYIVTVNGKDYYNSTYIGYYPDCSQATFEGKEYNSYALNDEDYDNLTKNYLDSMTYAAKDINLSGLGADFEGYLTVGATGTNITTNNCDFTVTKINTHDAATWQGEVACQHLETEVVTTKEANCGYDGEKAVKCVACGKVLSKEAIPATGEHTLAADYVVTKAPTCVAEGEKTKSCTECEKVIETLAIEIDPEAHNKVTKDIIAPTCTEKGTQQDVCSLCDVALGEVVEVEALDHDDGEWVVTVPSGCVTDGTSELQCTRCGYVKEQRNDGSLGHDYNSAWVTVVEPTFTEPGLEKQICSRCEEVIDQKEVPVLDYVNPFPDVKENHWFYSSVEYCVKKGYVTGMNDGTFTPNGKLTRAQFVTILAKLDGVDLTQYETTDAGFADVKTSHWYNEVVCWAVENGITSGLSADKFGPNNSVTRSQVARFFYVYSEKTGVNVEDKADISAFPDANKVRDWAKESVEWAVNAGLISGVAKDGKTYLDPDGTATRAQATVMFQAFDAYRSK